ncbi:class I SAM-dependent methyltransferase [Candidatus Nitrosocosmicus hydrocola]|uniref:class I SAM-dependent methyltransferase n=1 Tax=Candidatus Nitrosocosmicus hydrocola TaxID=1826872 RepID=UPI0011E5EFDA|nr:class I SAM-dependent methyltransferase [Candidatus Nitrosocosmicus hydrocola]
MNSNIGVEYARAFFAKENSRDYDRLVRLATLGQDSMWKKKIVSKIPTNSFVLDLACGTGILSSLLIKNGDEVLGIDLTWGYLEMIDVKGIEMDLVNANAEMLPFVDNTFDFVVTSYLPKYTNLNLLVNECYRVLKSDGCIILHDFTHPKNPLYRYAWKNYFRLIKYIWRNDEKWKNVFSNLDVLIKQNEWDLRIGNILRTIGFNQIVSSYLTFQTSLVVTAIKNDF